MGAQRITVEVPRGCGPGDVITVEFCAQSFAVEVPNDCFVGSTFDVEVPCEEPPAQRTYEIVVPEGVTVGQMLSVETDGGKWYEISVPDGCGPGSVLSIQLDALEADSATPTDEYATPAASPDPRTTGTPPISAAVEWPPHSQFGSQERVEILRKDGSYSRGTVECAFEGVFGVLYQVRMDNGVYKQAVPEEELYRCATDADDEVVDSDAKTLLMWQMAQMDDGYD